ncbi:hypothetical protein BH23BAC1_BH23BAC1_08840 [soil metagenome]
MHYSPPNNISFLWLILLMYLRTPVYAQNHSFVQLKSEPVFTISSGEEQAGEEQDLSLFFVINEGYHIQADQVKDENLIPSVLSIEAPGELIIGVPVFPKAEEFRMNGVEEPLQVFSNVLEIKVLLKQENQ